MEQPSQSACVAAIARRNEDIAVDLMRVIASFTHTGRSAAPTAGFVASHGAKPEDQIDAMLDLYRRCLSAVDRK